MDSGLAARMFHTLVVMGAALGAGCGPTPPSDGGDSSGAAPDTTGGPPQPTTVPVDPSAPDPTVVTTGVTATSDGSTATQTGTSEAPTTAVDPETGNTTSPPDDPADCEFPQQFKCDDNFRNCFCDPTAPLSPDDCRSPTQFICQQPWSDPPWGCECDPDAPAAPEDCPSPVNFNCVQYDPIAVGCRCECWQFGPPNPQSEADCANAGPFFCSHQPFECCCQIQLG